MSFFGKLKEKLFKSASKLKEGLDAVIQDGGKEEEIEVADDAVSTPESKAESPGSDSRDFGRERKGAGEGEPGKATAKPSQHVSGMESESAAVLDSESESADKPAGHEVGAGLGGGESAERLEGKQGAASQNQGIESAGKPTGQDEVAQSDESESPERAEEGNRAGALGGDIESTGKIAKEDAAAGEAGTQPAGKSSLGGGTALGEDIESPNKPAGQNSVARPDEGESDERAEEANQADAPGGDIESTGKIAKEDAVARETEVNHAGQFSLDDAAAQESRPDSLSRTAGESATPPSSESEVAPPGSESESSSDLAQRDAIAREDESQPDGELPKEAAAAQSGEDKSASQGFGEDGAAQMRASEAGAEAANEKTSQPMPSANEGHAWESKAEEEKRPPEKKLDIAGIGKGAVDKAEAQPEEGEEREKKPGLMRRLFGRVQKKKVVRRILDDEMLESLEEVLITSDLGVNTAMRISANLAEGRFGRKYSTEEISEILCDEIARIMEPVAKPMPLYAKKPQVVLVVGVNGSGKTTTIGKLASQFRAAGKSVVIAAGDTFRAAAVEQLQIWGDRAGVPVLTAPEGSDPASLAFQAIEKAEREGIDLLLIDTAGRLQNRTDLMEELAKIVRVIRKKDETAPHNTILVLDASIGQNATSQVESFQKMADVSGLVMTKLDGTAKGGILVSLADQFGLPIHAIGVGEGLDDLSPFDPREFAMALTGAES